MTRDERGRFAKGNPGGPGRKPRATEQEYRDAFCEVVPLDRFIRMIEAQARRADKGDLKAFEALVRYIAPAIEKQQLEHSGGVEITVRYVD